MSSPTTTSIVCVCPYCKTGYEWWVNCDCLAEEADTEEADTEEAEEAWDADFITCHYCGNRWDGYAQCTCWGYLNSSAQVNDDEEDDTTRNAKGTIIEIDYGTTTDEDEDDDEEEDTTRNAKGGGTIIEIDYGTTTDEEEED